ncbi:MAG: hypothetical protein IPN26_17995 [Bacteroidetes bacterium]|nr:hypothetical protein [Bacteroidota bacterium]
MSKHRFLMMGHITTELRVTGYLGQISMNGTCGVLYYAENNDAAALPARAEHEFYLLRAAYQEPQLAIGDQQNF